MRSLLLACACLTPCATPALAEDREFCADRPGLGTPPCTLAPGEAMIEVGLAGLERDRDAASVTDTLTLGDSLLRVGIGERAEVQIGLTGFVHTRDEDRLSGAVAHDSGVGDATIAVRRGLAGANGPLALEAFFTLPIGQPPAGGGDWGGGLLLPFQHDLPHGFQLALTPELDAAVDADGHGRHLAYGGVVGLAHDLGQNVSLSGELAGFEDRDPAGHGFDGRLAGSLAWQLGRRFQLDIEADAGLTPAAPRHALLIGVARRLR